MNNGRQELVKSNIIKLSALKKGALIKENIGEYTITKFGKMIYCIQLMMEQDFENRWKLMAVDSVETEDAVPEEEFV